MDTILSDLRFALRQLARRPGFAAVGVATLALGIGLATAMFSVLDGVLLRPLPYDAPGRLVTIRQSWTGVSRGFISPAEYVDYVARARALSPVGGYVVGAANLTGDGEAERLPAGYVSAGALRALGVPPVAGRWFEPADDTLGAANVVLLSDGLWRRRFGGSSIVGRTITVDGQPATVVGVMPRGFALPEDLVTGSASEIFQPLQLGHVDRTERGSHFLRAIARLAPGVTLADGAAEARALAAGFRREFPDKYPVPMQFEATVAPLHTEVIGDVERPTMVLFGAVIFVLLIACANVANLLLARADGRRREFAIRTALGAARLRLARQLAVEHLLLSGAGGIVGAVLAYWIIAAIRVVAPEDLPRIGSIGLDGRSLLFAAAAAVLAGLGFGLVPALRRLDAGLAARLREAGAGMTAGRQRHRTRRALVIAEAALATALAAGAGLMARSFARLQAVDPGFRTQGVLTARIMLPDQPYGDSTRDRDYYSTLVERVAALPGVRSAGAVTNLPLTGSLGDINIQIEGRETPRGALHRRSDWQVVTPGYFDAMGMRLLRGRGIEAGDRENTPGAVVINEALARLYWPGADPIGARFRLGGGAAPGVVTVVGVVANVRHASLGAPPDPELYLAHRQFRFWNGGGAAQGMTIVLHTAGMPVSLAAGLRSAVAAIDPSVPVGLVRPMDAVAATSVAQPRFLALLFGAFSVAALLLSGVGLYGVLAYIVSLRGNEFAVRLAFGASAARLGAMVVRDAMGLVLAGIGAGLVMALLLGRLLRGLLYDVAPADPAALLIAAGSLLVVAALAVWVPARRALMVAPAAALRGE